MADNNEQQEEQQWPIQAPEGFKWRKIDMYMLSGLPDEILHHVLSFLPTNLSVRTSVLARRWRFLWALVPNLEFRRSTHLDIIDRVVSMHEAKPLNTFSLSNVEGSSYRLETLIIHALKRSVRNMYLDFGDIDYKEYIACGLPGILFMCKTLVDLKLNNCGVIPSSGEVFMPCLKKLDLSNVDYEDKDSLPHLLSGCSVIEELIIDDFFREEETNLGCFIVSSPTIKKLNIDFSSSREQYYDEMLIINLPALVYLKVSGCYLEYAKSSMKTMSSLIEADIKLNGHWHDCHIDCIEHDCSRAFLSSLCHVRYLNITSYGQEKLVDIVGTSSMPKFVNLTKLVLNMNAQWHFIAKFLEVADNLEDLIIRSTLMPYREPERVPSCILFHLRTVRIEKFGLYDDSGFDMVRYILRNAQVLERMDIDGFPRYSSSDKEKLDAHQRISLFERGSKSCQIFFNS